MTTCGPHCPPASRRALRGPPRTPGHAENCRLFALSPSPRPPRPPSAHLSGRPVPPDRRGTARVSGGGVWSGARGSSGRPGPSRGSEGGGAGVRRAGGPELAAPRPRPPPLPWCHEGRDTCRKAPEPQMVPRRGPRHEEGGKLGISLGLLRKAEFAWGSSQGQDHVRSVIPYHAAQRVPNAAGGSGKAFGARQE